jgi:H/ACA ribonucleoprotein complex subunit 3
MTKTPKMPKTTVYIRGQPIQVTPQQAIGKGGEADIFKLDQGEALKLFKPANHPDYQGNPLAQRGAEQRLQEHQSKLRAFPSGLPERVIHPHTLATDRSQSRILGYTMRLVNGSEVLSHYSERSFRQQGILNQDIIQIFQDLYQTVEALHRSQIVIGDFNDLNVLVQGTKAYLIDSDSFQFQGFTCRMFTFTFLDPLLMDPQGCLAQEYTPNSDWYAFSVMLMRSLLWVGPYGGVYQNPQHRIPHEARPQQRITVFHPQVRYPKPAIPYTILPDELLHHFQQVFEKDLRGIFPKMLLDTLRWTTCSVCGLEHARPLCPTCVGMGSVKQVVMVSGKVVATQIFKTEGLILHASLQDGRLRWLYYEQESFKREDGQAIFQGSLNPGMQFALQGKTTLLGWQHQLLCFSPGQDLERIPVDPYEGYLSGLGFSANARHRYWISQGRIYRNGTQGSIYLGDVLQNQTRFWIGSDFGFGFYRAGEIRVGFILFDQGLKDTVSLPHWSGGILKAHCVFSQTLCWFFVKLQINGSTVQQCLVIDPKGEVIAQAESPVGDGSWLNSIGSCAVGSCLFAATDAGILRLEPRYKTIEVTKHFPETEPFVDDESSLFPSPEGIQVVRRHTIQVLKLA